MRRVVRFLGAVCIAVSACAVLASTVAASPPPTIYLQLVATAASGSLPPWNGVVSVAPGSSYTVATTGCGTGWTPTVVVTSSRYPAGEVLEANPAVTVSQTDGGLSITHAVPADVQSGPRQFQNYIVPLVELLNINCVRGQEIAVGRSVAYVEPVSEFVRWQRLFALHAVLGWQIQPVACTTGSAATLDITSSAFVGRTSATIRADGVAMFEALPVDPANPAGSTGVPWSAVFVDPSAVFVVACSGADGQHVITLTSNATLAPATPDVPATLPGTGSGHAPLGVGAAASVLMGAALLVAAARLRARAANP